ncbi:MAG: AMP-binding protein, partial [bacterium]|nr:AMP-binding protein [bacterium]
MKQVITAVTVDPDIKIAEIEVLTPQERYKLLYWVNEIPGHLQAPEIVNEHLGEGASESKIYILDKNLNPLPVGAIGEIYLSGPGVEIENENTPALTAEKYKPNPYETGDYSRMYALGELGRRLPGGGIHRVKREEREITKEAGEVPGLPLSVVGARNAVEEKLAAIWKKLLGKDEIGVRDDFFRMGGNSIKALLLVSEIDKEFERTLLITDIFELQ